MKKPILYGAITRKWSKKTVVDKTALKKWNRTEIEFQKTWQSNWKKSILMRGLINYSCHFDNGGFSTYPPDARLLYSLVILG